MIQLDSHNRFVISFDNKELVFRISRLPKRISSSENLLLEVVCWKKSPYYKVKRILALNWLMLQNPEEKDISKRKWVTMRGRANRENSERALSLSIEQGDSLESFLDRLGIW